MGVLHIDIGETRKAIYRLSLELMPRSLALAIQFWRTQARWPNLHPPQTFNEKLQWRKLHDRRPILPVIIDKVAVKSLLAERLAAQDWLIPTLWFGPRLSAQILATIEPPYIIKPNHASQRILINRGERDDLEALASAANDMLAAPHPRFLHEWPYTRIREQLLIERLIGADGKVPYDYKFYVFNGRVEFIQVDTDRETDHRRILYDREWRQFPAQYKIARRTSDVPRPSQFDRMAAFAERAADVLALEFIRVDLYEVNGRTYFGELTPFPSSGFAKFDPPCADLEIGKFWRLPTRAQLAPRRGRTGKQWARPMRESAPDLVRLDGPEGRRLLFESEAHAAFFPLVSQFETQGAMTSCGPATLVMVLNALEIPAPQQRSHDHYRFFTQENVLNGIASTVIKGKAASRGGVSLRQMADVLRHYGLNVETHYASASSVEAFRNLAKACLAQEREFVIINYNRSALGQTGSGHISPLAAYDAESDRFLILDVARYKSPPVWIKAERLFAAMAEPISSRNPLTRGFLLVRSKAQATEGVEASDRAGCA